MVRVLSGGPGRPRTRPSQPTGRPTGSRRIASCLDRPASEQGLRRLQIAGAPQQPHRGGMTKAADTGTREASLLDNFWVTVSTPPIRSTRFHRSSHSLRRKRCWICRQHTLGRSFTAPAEITVDVATQSLSRGSSDCHSNDLRDEALTCVGTAFAIPTIDRDKYQKIFGSYARRMAKS